MEGYTRLTICVYWWGIGGIGGRNADKLSGVIGSEDDMTAGTVAPARVCWLLSISQLFWRNVLETRLAQALQSAHS